MSFWDVKIKKLNKNILLTEKNFYFTSNNMKLSFELLFLPPKLLLFYGFKHLFLIVYCYVTVEKKHAAIIQAFMIKYNL
jgi:hypothetical protein